jgi:hypothetical protein
MSGTLVLRHLDAFRAEVGEDTVARALAGLPGELQKELDALVSGGWLAVDQLDRVYDAIAHEASRSIDELLPIVATRGNEEAFSTIWKVLLRMAPGRLLLRRSTAVFRKTYTHGVMEAVETGSEVYLELTHWPGITKNRMVGIAAGTRAAMRVAGYPDTRVDYQPTDDGARFTLRF